MAIVQLYKDGESMVATDGRMHIDGRLGIERATLEVTKRNSLFEKNFPHKIATAFEYKGQYIILPKTEKS